MPFLTGDSGLDRLLLAVIAVVLFVAVCGFIILHDKYRMAHNPKVQVKTWVKEARDYYKRHNYPEAVTAYEQAITVLRNTNSQNTRQYAHLLKEISLALEYAHEWGKAKIFARQAVEYARSVIGVGEEAYADYLLNMIWIVGSHDHAVELEAMMREAYDASAAKYGTDHPVYGRYAKELGDLMQTLNRFPEAETFYRQALAIEAKTLEMEQPAGAITYDMSLYNLAWVLRQMGQTEEAETCYRDAVEVCRNIWGTRDTRYHEALEALTGFLNDQGRGEEVQSLLAERVKHIDETQDNPEDLVDLATQLLVAGNYKKADPLFRRAESVFDAQWPKHAIIEDPEYDRNEYNLAALLLITGRYEEAKTRLLSVLNAIGAGAGVDVDAYTDALHNLEVLIATAYPADQGAWVYLEIIKDEDEGLDLYDLGEDIQAQLQAASRPSEALAVLKAVDATDEPILAAARRFAKGEPPPKGVRIALQDWDTYHYTGDIPVKV